MSSTEKMPVVAGGATGGRGLATVGARHAVMSRRRRNANAAVISAFQPDAVELDERRLPSASRLTLYFLAALIAAGVTWASLSHVDIIVSARGKLITAAPNLTVQPLETSVIRDVRVSVGDVVHEGEVLALLDPTFTQADFDQLQTRVAALDAAVNRLRAELGDSSVTLTSAAGPDEIIQKNLLVHRKAYYDAQLRNFGSQFAAALDGKKESKNEEALLLQRLDTLRSIEAMRGELMNKELGSRLNFLLARDARLEVESSLVRLHGSQADYGHRAQKAYAEMQAFVGDFHRTTEQELIDTLAKRDSAAEDLKKAALRKQLVVLKAPTDSIVLEIPTRAIGSVVRQAEPMFVLVRRNVPLRAEVRVDEKDVAKLNIGQLVRIKLDAYPFQKYGTLEGEVRVISRDSFVPEARTEIASQSPLSFYRVLVDLRDTQSAERSKEILAIPGMGVTAEMKVGNRSVISYFLYPLLRGLDESIREP